MLLKISSTNVTQKWSTGATQIDIQMSLKNQFYSKALLTKDPQALLKLAPNVTQIKKQMLLKLT